MKTISIESDLLAFVKASASLMGLQLDDARTQRVAEHLGRTAQLAKALDGLDLSHKDEMDGAYYPAPFSQSLKV